MPLLISSVAFFLAVILGCSTPVDALEFRSISGPPETSGNILRGGSLVITCTRQYPGDLDSSTLFLVGTAGERTQVSFSSLNSSTSQAVSIVQVPQQIDGGHYFLVAVESNRSVIASSPNFTIDNATVSSTSSASSPTESSSDQGSNSSPGSSGSNAGAIAGGVIGGVVGLAAVVVAVLLFLRRRRVLGEKKMITPDISTYFTEPTPIITGESSQGQGQGAGPPSAAKEKYLMMQEQKEQMLGMRQRLERRLEDNMAEHRMRIANPDGSSVASQSGQDTVPELRRQLDVMSQRIHELEAELAEQAPPDYVSTI
ncbi:hypothetical protein VNI00_013993 [Paramarasmius palmivorus]|uniref:Uncharacterized protein n=1 Tax=Paramarasmius palmivorus TaxID=297713 RepID=A0AAW0BVD7_9AGAR